MKGSWQYTVIAIIIRLTFLSHPICDCFRPYICCTESGYVISNTADCIMNIGIALHYLPNTVNHFRQSMNCVYESLIVNCVDWLTFFRRTSKPKSVPIKHVSIIFNNHITLNTSQHAFKMHVIWRNDRTSRSKISRFTSETKLLG